MAFVHEDSCECLKSDLELFSVPSTQTSVETGNWIEYHPLTTVDDSSPIEFDISGNGKTISIWLTLCCTYKSR